MHHPALTTQRKEKGGRVLAEGTFRKTVDPELWRPGRSEPGEHWWAGPKAERAAVQRPRGRRGLRWNGGGGGLRIGWKEALQTIADIGPYFLGKAIT